MKAKNTWFVYIPKAQLLLKEKSQRLAADDYYTSSPDEAANVEAPNREAALEKFVAIFDKSIRKPIFAIVDANDGEKFVMEAR